MFRTRSREEGSCTRCEGTKPQWRRNSRRNNGKSNDIEIPDIEPGNKQKEYFETNRNKPKGQRKLTRAIICTKGAVQTDSAHCDRSL